MVVYYPEAKEDVEEYISMKFDTPFSLDKDKCEYVCEDAYIEIEPNHRLLEVYDCIRIKDKFYSLNSSHTMLKLDEIKALSVQKVENKDIDIIYADEKYKVPTIDLSEDFLSFRKAKYIEQNIEMKNEDDYTKKLVEEFLSQKYNADFSIERDSYSYRINNADDLPYSGQAIISPETLFSCIKLGENYYSLGFYGQELTLTPLEVIGAEDVKYTSKPVIVTYCEFNNAPIEIDLSEEWQQFLVAKQNQQNQNCTEF